MAHHLDRDGILVKVVDGHAEVVFAEVLGHRLLLRGGLAVCDWRRSWRRTWLDMHVHFLVRGRGSLLILLFTRALLLGFALVNETLDVVDHARQRRQVLLVCERTDDHCGFVEKQLQLFLSRNISAYALPIYEVIVAPVLADIL